MDYLSKLYLIKSLKIKDETLLSIFTHPKESRFQNLFENFKTKKKRKTMTVSPKNIMLGLDKRTSIIIKNIPENITSEQFKLILLNFNQPFDFFYIPLKIRTRKNLRVAFVNVIKCNQIVPIYMGLLYKMKFIYDNPDIEMEICYSKVQGKVKLTERFFHEFNKLAPSH
jgi:hypothetical protein